MDLPIPATFQSLDPLEAVVELPVALVLALPVVLSADFHHRVYHDLTVALEQVEEVVEATAYH